MQQASSCSIQRRRLGALLCIVSSCCFTLDLLLGPLAVDKDVDVVGVVGVVDVWTECA